MVNHTVIDTNNMKKSKFTFDNLNAKQKNMLIGGSLSFAGILAAVGIHRLFSPPAIASESPDISVKDLNDLPDVVTTKDPMEVASTQDFEAAVEIESFEPVEEVTDYSFSINTDAAFATSVENYMTFEEAFATARAEIGAGGFFNWNGNSYSTFTEAEWNNASFEEQQLFFSNVNSKLDLESYKLEPATPENTMAEASAIEPSEVVVIDIATPTETVADEETLEAIAASASTSNDGPGTDTESGNLQMQVDLDGTANSHSTASDVVADQVQIVTVVPPTSYGTGDMNEDGIVDAIAIDNNGDGYADLVAMDEDFDGTYDSFMINEDGDEDLDIFIIDQGGDGIDDSDTIEEIGDIVDMQDFVIVDEEDDALEGLDFIDDLIDIDSHDEIVDDTSNSSEADDLGL